jgi:hypothetical protein
MAAKQLRNTNTHIAAKFTRLFGPPPLLQIEDTKIYEAILERLAREERPQTVIAWILIRDLADLVYQRLWLGGLGMRLIKHVHRSKPRSDLVAKVRRELDEIFGEAFKRTTSKDGEAIEHNNEEIDSCEQSEVPEEAQAEAAPIDEAATFAEWIGSYERVQDLLEAADKKFTNTLKLLDERRDGVGRRVREVADAVVVVSPRPIPSRKERPSRRMSLPRRSARSRSRCPDRSTPMKSGAAVR